MKKIILIVLGLLLISCSQDSKTETTVEVKEVVVEVKEQEPVAKAKIEKEVVVKAEPKIAVATKSGQEIFMTCAACHGKNAEKVALGKSKVIQGWSVEKITTAINGYKDGTYGGQMKGLMKAQAANLSNEDIQKVASFISKL